MLTGNNYRHAGGSKGCGLCLCLVLMTAAAGCDLLIPFAVLGEHKVTVPPEFDKLEGKRVAIVVWAEQETLFDYPHVRLELALHVADAIAASVKNVDVVDGRAIEDHIERNLATAVDPEFLGRTFNCDLVIYIELLRFQIRDPRAPDFLRASINAAVSVYDLGADPDEPGWYELQDVTAVYPESETLMLNETNAIVVRKQVYEKFAEMVARKFHKHERDM